MTKRSADQRAQDWIGRHISRQAAQWIFHRRVRWYIWRGRVAGARITGSED